MDIAIVSIFFWVMILVGLFSLKAVKNTAGFFVADRRGTTTAITGSLLATIIGGSGTIGLAGLGYSKGLAGAWWMLVGAIGLMVLSIFFASKVRGFKVFTLPEILEAQYGGSTVKIVASFLIATAWLGIISAQIIAAGKILSVLWPGQLPLLMIISASVFIIYTVLGGQYSILRTDLIQSIIIISGILVCLVAGIFATKGLAATPGQLPEGFFSFPTSPEFTVRELLHYFLFVGATFLVGPDIYSRIFSAKNKETAQKSTMIAALVMVPLAFGITFIGITARMLLPEIPPESALPSLIMQIIPAGLSGLVIAALLAAMMSSADTCLLTTGIIISADIIQPLFGSKMSEKKLLMISRLCVMVAGTLSLVIALEIQSIIAALLVGYTIYSSGLVVPIILGFYRKRLKLNTLGAIVAVIAGGGLGLYLKTGGYNNLLLVTLPLSAIFLIGGSYAGRFLSLKKKTNVIKA
ncbi:MAG: sodium:solute symporter family protein [Deltaproteobacteria bacterium]|nr:sodium:solute symporter family protein [Deltaproteobacteria bacterium]MBN2845505.1 sodium:solute symporter family protein [Deltaproteobacteria bacterium]